MSLSNRFLILLLGTLGLVLVGLSTALYVTSRIYLDRRVDDRLTAILSMLNTCADATPGWVRWEPREKRLPPSRWRERDATTWLVTDGRGHLLTCPRDLRHEELRLSWASRIGAGTLTDRVRDRMGRSWRVSLIRLGRTGGDPLGGERPRDTPDGKSYHDEVVLVAFASLEETERTLASLGSFLVGIGLVVWITAALCARWLLRKAMGPLTRLVESARVLDSANPDWTLAEVGTNDELDDLRRAFNELLARLHEAYDRQRRFSSEASHQLRTPVAVMIGHLEVAQRHERSGEHYRRVIQLAHQRAVDLGRIVESLLFLSRPDRTTLTQSALIDLNSWLAKHLADRPADDRSSDIALRSSGPGTLWIKAQPHLLGQAVDNLLENACKYSSPGQPIVVETARDGESAVIVVQDSGCGIAPGDLTRIFEPFYRSSTSHHQVPGAGLGLSVVDRIVRAFGGTVTARSEVGRGSRFELRLPVDSSCDDEPSLIADSRPVWIDADRGGDPVAGPRTHPNTAS
jgi:signal transduction histidine kinase